MNYKILFVTWDGPQTSYLEGLFMPIFNEISQRSRIEIHVIQFTWANNYKIEKIKQLAANYNIKYRTEIVYRTPNVYLGSLWTLLTSASKIKKYIKKYKIDLIIPRSTLPAFMVQMINYNLPILFDADGLPIEERVDFAGLRRNGLVYNLLQKIESRMIRKADFVITRSQKAIDYFSMTYPSVTQKKFGVVGNGRDTGFFNLNSKSRSDIKNELGLKENTTVFVYAGSFGPQYGWSEMLSIFEDYNKFNHDCFFIFLTGSPEMVKPLVPKRIQTKFLIKSVDFDKIPFYLNAGDIAFAIREPKFSMKGVAPIKLGEYLLVGIPTIASKGIGDTEEQIIDFPGVFIYDHINNPEKQDVINFIEKSKMIDRKLIRESAIPIFSLEAAAESYLKAITRFFS